MDRLARGIENLDAEVGVGRVEPLLSPPCDRPGTPRRSDKRIVLDTAMGYLTAVRGQEADLESFNLVDLCADRARRLHEVR
jgi:hypothetical protein